MGTPLSSFQTCAIESLYHLEIELQNDVKIWSKFEEI